MANLVYSRAIDSKSAVTATVKLEDHALIGAAAVAMHRTKAPRWVPWPGLEVVRCAVVEQEQRLGGVHPDVRRLSRRANG